MLPSALRSFNFGILLSFLPAGVIAQDCASVYASSVRNISLETSQRSEQAFYFSLYCERTGESKSFTAAGNFSFPIEGLPIDISATGSFNQDELKQFCDIGSSENFYQSSDFSYGSFVVRDSLASFNECRRLELSDILITHTENAPIGVTINVVPKTADPIRMNGFNFDPERLTCTSTDFNEDRLAQPIDGKTGFDVTSKFAISCTRIPIQGDGMNYYPFTAFTVSTTEGSYTARLREDSLLGFGLASEAKAALDALIVENNNLRNQVLAVTADRDAVNRAFLSVSPSLHMLVVGDNVGRWSGFAGVSQQAGPVADAAANVQRVCGESRVASYIVPLATDGGGHGFDYIIVSCMPLTPY